MDLSYDSVMKFFEEYFPAYNAYAQDPETIYRMYDYFAPDFEFIPYVAGLEHTTTRDEFLGIMSSHPTSYETITADDVFYDERSHTAAVLARTEVVDRNTGEVVVKKSYLPRYHLVLDENDTIKIKGLEFFWEVLPPGALEVHEVFRRDL